MDKPGALGEQRVVLQRAIDITSTYTFKCGLTCSPEKPALLTLQQRTRGRHTARTPNPALAKQTRPVPVITHLTVLSLTIPRGGSGSHIILELQRTTAQLAQLVKRIAHQRIVASKKPALVQAFLISHHTYGTPSQSLKPAENKKLVILIIQA